jgi:hypothetical protein
MNNPYPAAPHPDSLGVGALFQDFVIEVLSKRGINIQVYTSKEKQLTVGESIQGFEIKLDSRSADTGRLSIEVAEKSNPNNAMWVDSGIFRKDNAIFYIQGNYMGFYVFEKKTLIHLFRKHKFGVSEFNGTIRRFYLPLDLAARHCLMYVDTACLNKPEVVS